jgi:hypothetical protein
VVEYVLSIWKALDSIPSTVFFYFNNKKLINSRSKVCVPGKSNIPVPKLKCETREKVVHSHLNFFHPAT